MASVMKRFFVGRPLATTQMEHQRLSKTIALAVFSSDALSSTAYATEEILFVAAIGASSLALGLDTLVPIAIVVAFLLAIVIVSYRQVIFAYPGGGGAYIVSRENISESASLVAGRRPARHHTNGGLTAWDASAGAYEPCKRMGVASYCVLARRPYGERA